MKITHFKTYQPSAPIKLESNLPEAPISLFHTRSEEQKEVEFTLGSNLKSTLEKNKSSLKHQKKFKTISPQILEVLGLVKPQESENPAPTTIHIPKMSSNEAWETSKREVQNLRYIANCKDPYFKIRNHQHIYLSY